jgi:spore germination protein KB
MSYQPGRMGMAEATGLIFIVTLPRVFLTTPALGLGEVKNLAWATILIAWLAALAMLYLLASVTGRRQGDLFAVSEQLLGRLGASLIAIYYIAIFLVDAALLLRQFAENTILTALPYADFNVVSVWFLAFAVIIVYFGLEGLARATYLLLPFIVAGILTVILLLAPFYETYRLFPWQGGGLGTALLRGLELTGANFGVIILFIFAPLFQTANTIKVAAVYGGSGSAILKTLVVLSFLLAFGVAKGIEKTLPFFEMSRLVYLSRYITRIESLFIVIWVFVSLLTIAVNLYVVLYLISRVLSLPTFRPLIPAVAVIVLSLAALPSDITTVAELDSLAVTTIFNAGIVGIPVILFAAAWLKGRRKRRCVAS